MRIQITLRMPPQGHIALKTYDNAVALVHPQSQTLQIFRDTLVNKYLIAEYHSDAYLSWEYVSAHPSRAEQLLLHHEK
jgi:hypothetical protein